MKRKILAVCMVLMFGLIACGKKELSRSDLETQMDKVSYVMGHNIANNFKDQKIDIQMDAFIKGIKDGLKEDVNIFSIKEVQEIMTEYQNQMRDKTVIDRKDVSKINLNESKAFLAENKEKEGIVTLESGLQYKVLKEGTGPFPKATDKVKTHYVGTLIDGTEFDSSVKRGEPITFSVTGVIPGWTEALKLMKVGSKWNLFIPPELAYGENGAGNLIGPNAALIFEVELISIEK
jgi:FKBP-type peptidyl-prolyl cis-trans isomerase